MSSDHPETWSVSKIKQVLTQHHVDSAGCVEKEELLELLHKLPEYQHWKVPHHAEAYEQTTHIEHPHYFDEAQKGTSQPTKPARAEHTEKKHEETGSQQPDTHPETWSVSKIKQVLTQHKVDHSACVEKEELLELLHRLPEYKNWQVPHHPDSHDQTSHVDAPHFYEGK